jgi:hypothetical protein
MVLSQAIPQLPAALGLDLLGVTLAPSSAAVQAVLSALAIAVVCVYFLILVRIAALQPLFASNAAFKMALWADDAGPVTTPIALKDHPSWHPRSSLVSLLLVTIALGGVGAAVFGHLPTAGEVGFKAQLVTCGARVLLLPLVIGVVEEFQRAIARLGHGGPSSGSSLLRSLRWT